MSKDFFDEDWGYAVKLRSDQIPIEATPEKIRREPWCPNELVKSCLRHAMIRGWRRISCVECPLYGTFKATKGQNPLRAKKAATTDYKARKKDLVDKPVLSAASVTKKSPKKTRNNPKKYQVYADGIPVSDRLDRDNAWQFAKKLLDEGRIGIEIANLSTGKKIDMDR